MANETLSRHNAQWREPAKVPHIPRWLAGEEFLGRLNFFRVFSSLPILLQMLSRHWTGRFL